MTLDKAIAKVREAFAEQRQAYEELAQEHDRLRKAYRDLADDKDVLSVNQEIELLDWMQAAEFDLQDRSCLSCLNSKDHGHRTPCVVEDTIKLLQERINARK